MDIMQTDNREMLLQCAGDGKANKYACYKSSSASSHKKIIQKTQKWTEKP